MGKQTRLYMVRSTQGALYNVFSERGVVALAWPMLAEAATKGFGREELTDIYRSAVPDVKLRTAQSGAAQMWRFVNELADGDGVLTYSPALRRYRVGRITGSAVHCPQWDDEKMSLVRPVEWLGEVCRDDLSVTAQRALGSVATLFAVSEACAAEIFERVGFQTA
ncbi:TPA: restriction endonuclease [Neisseria subflava]